MRHPSTKIGLGAGVSLEQMLYNCSSHVSHTHIPPAAEAASNHPNYNLLGFSAALAPKFTTESFIPMRVGYASTLHKVQGATLPHITLWLDIANMPAAAYVALSRVQHDADWRFAKNHCVHQFTPARQ